MTSAEAIAALSALDLGKLLKDKARAKWCIDKIHVELVPFLPRILVTACYHGVVVPLGDKSGKVLQNARDSSAHRVFEWIGKRAGFEKLIGVVKSSIHDALPEPDGASEISGSDLEERAALKSQLENANENLELFFEELGGMRALLEEIANVANFENTLFLPSVEGPDDRPQDQLELYPETCPIDLLGRGEDQDAVHDFLCAPNSFSWQVITGSAGSGKTRLAFHALREQTEGWEKGIVADTDFVWSGWHPIGPTLIVVDNALNKTDEIRNIFSRCFSLANKNQLLFNVRLLLLERSFPDKPEAVYQHAQWGSIVDSSVRVEFENAQFSRPVRLEPLDFDDAVKIVKSVITRGAEEDSDHISLPEELSERLKDDDNKELRLPLFLILAGQALRQEPDVQKKVAWNVNGLVNFALSAPERCPFFTGEPDDLRASACVAFATISGTAKLAETIPGFEATNQPKSNAIAENITGGRGNNLSLRPDILGEFFCLKFLDYLQAQQLEKYQNFLKFLFNHGRYYSEWEMTQRTKEFFRRMGSDIAVNGEGEDWAAFIGHASNILRLIHDLSEDVPQFFKEQLVLAVGDSSIHADDFDAVELALGYSDNKDKAAIWSRALKLAIDQNASNVVKEILNRIDANGLKKEHLNSGLFVAAQKSEVITDDLLSAGADANAADPNLFTALHVAAQKGHTPALERLLAAGADINAKSEKRSTAMSLAAEGGHISCITALLARKDDISDINEKGVNDSTALHWAAAKGHEEVVKLLLDAGADVNAADTNNVAPLHAAALGGHASVLDALLAAGADVNTAGSEKLSALHAAARGGHATVLDALLAAGADVNAIGPEKLSALHVAAEGGHALTLERLLAAGADINAKTEKGATAMSLAAEGGHVSCITALLARKDDISDINEKGVNNSTALEWAATKGHEGVVELLLDAGADVNAADPNLFTALHAAAQGGHAPALERLLAAGADINARSRKGATALSLAAEGGYVSCITALLARKDDISDINEKGVNNSTALHWAAANGHDEAVKLLLDAGANVNAADADRFTVLHASAQGGHASVLDALLVAGADINAKSKKGSTAMSLAAEGGHVSCITALLARKDDISDINEKVFNNSTALHWAAAKGHDEVIKLLLDAGADVNAADINNIVALHAAALGGHASVLDALLAAGADVNAAGNEKFSALHVAAQGGHAPALESLLEAGADINAKTEKGATAMSLAAEGGHVSCITALLARKDDISDINQKGVNNSTALEWAAAKGHEGVVKLLLDAGADVNSADADKFTVLHAAAQGGHASVIEALLAAGADINAKSVKGSTAMSLAAEGGHESCIKVLLAHRDEIDDIDERVADDRTALYWAAAMGHVEVVQLLLEAGAEVDAADSINSTAFLAAAQEGHTDVLEVLLAAGANINKRMDNGATALHIAVVSKKYPVLKFLLAHDADKQIPDSKSATPWVVAKLAEDELSIRLLESSNPSQIEIEKDQSMDRSADAGVDGPKTGAKPFPMSDADIEAVADHISCSPDDAARFIVYLGVQVFKHSPKHQLRELFQQL